MQRDGNRLVFDENDITASGNRLPPAVTIEGAHVLVQRLLEDAETLSAQATNESDSDMREDQVRSAQRMHAGSELSRLAANIQREVTPPPPAPMLPIKLPPY